MFIKLLLLFTVIPVVELYILISAGQHIGALTTVAIVIITGIIGANLARQQGYSVLAEMHRKTARREIPHKELFHGFCVLAGGLLLLTPGFLTDIVGFSLMIPGIRDFYISKVTSWFKKRNFSNTNFYFHSSRHPDRDKNSKKEKHDIIDSDDIE